MNTIPWSAILAVTLAAVLSLMLGWLFGRRGKSNAPLGLPEGSIRGILAITVTVAVLIYPALSSVSVPDFLENAFLLIIGLYFGNRSATPPAPSPSAPTAPAPKAPTSSSVGDPLPERNSGGFVRPQTLLLSLGVSVTALLAAALLTGCMTLGGEDSEVRDVKAAIKSAGELSALLPDSAVTDPKAKQALAVFRKLSGQDAEPAAPSAPAGELVSDGFFDLSGSPLVNGVRRVKTYRAIEEIAPPVAAEKRQPISPHNSITPSLPVVPPAAEPSAPSSSVGELVSSGAGGANSLPQPTQVRNSSTTGPTTSGPAQVLGARGISSIATARLVQVEARIVAVESPLAAEVSNATAVVELLLSTQGAVQAPAGASEARVEKLLVSGRVLEITNTAAAAQLDLKRLHFDGVAASVSEQGLVTAASPAGAEIQFEASLDADGNLRATAVPAAGSPAALFFQRVELAGRPLLNQYGVIITNAPAQAGTPNDPDDGIDLANAVSMGTHARVEPKRAAIDGELRSASLNEHDLVIDWTGNWHQPGAKKGDSGRAYLYWIGSDGRPRGGMFEWVSRGNTRRGLENIHGGYLDGEQPPKGAQCWAVLLSPDGSKRTNAKKAGTWK